MFKTLPLFKSHYSLGKSILTLDEPFDKKKAPVENSIFNLLLSNKIDTLVLVDDNVSGLLQASKNAKDNKIKLIFGLRISITYDMLDKTEESLSKCAKYIIFVKNSDGYKNLIKIWSAAAKDGFYYEPRLDFKTLKILWDAKNLSLAVPFYDSFLFLNSFESHIHVPDFGSIHPIFLIENNNLPFDDYLSDKVKDFAKNTNNETLNAQSIYYKSPDDFIAYISFRCLSKRSTLDKPELDHMGSDEFNFEKWLKNN